MSNRGRFRGHEGEEFGGWKRFISSAQQDPLPAPAKFFSVPVVGFRVILVSLNRTLHSA